MLNSIYIPMYAGFLAYGVYDMAHDKEYDIWLTDSEWMLLVMAYIVSSLLIVVMPVKVAAFFPLGLAVLHISAFTDSKRMLVPFGYIYVIVPLAIVCESLKAETFSCYSLIFLGVAVFGNIIGAYNTGDILLIFLVAEGFFLYSGNIIASLFFLIITMFLQTVLLVTDAIRTDNFVWKKMKLKRPMPVGGYLLISTYITTIGYIILNSIQR